MIQNIGHNPQVEGARGLFCLMVFFFHVVDAEMPGLTVLASGWPRLLLGTGEYGVELFFGISGFVILGALRRAPSKGAFLRARAIRIYPPLWGAMAVSAAFILVARPREFAQMPTFEILALLPANMAALPGIFPITMIHPVAWSMSYEMAFYLCAAGALWLGSVRGGVLVWAPVVALLVMLFPRGVFFLAGLMVAAGLSSRLPGADRLARYPGVMLLVFLLLWAAVQELSLPAHITHTRLWDWALDARLPLGLAAFIAAMLSLQGLVEGHGVLSRFLRSLPMQWMGRISYSFYLWHVTAIAFMRRVILALGIDVAAGTWSGVVLGAASLLLGLVLATLSWRLVEVWFCGRLTAWARLRRAAPAESAGRSVQ